MVHHIYLLTYVKPSLQHQDKAKLIMVDNLFLYKPVFDLQLFY